MKLFSVYDSKTNSYSQPMTQLTTPSAIRDFSAECKKSDSRLNQFAEDFTLFELASFDQDTGTIIPLATPHAVVKALDCKNQE